MRLVIQREKPINGAIPGTLYVDGAFYGYTLENEGMAIPTGTFSLYNRYSPKFAREKLHIEVPGRNYIMFHGLNYASQSEGCIGIAANRTQADVIQGDLSDVLYNDVKDVGGVLVVKGPYWWALPVAIFAAGIYIFIKH